MSDLRPRFYPLEPPVRLSAYPLTRRIAWEDLDARASELLGRDCLAIPSVRVGLCWTLEFLGCSRHRDHVLVPKFMGRCILNSLNRFALPVETPTPRTRLVVAVHQFGIRHDLEAVRRECAAQGWRYVEDSPCGFEPTEGLGPGAWAKFIGLSKVLPAVKGALVLSDDADLLAFFTRKRRETSLWSWPVFLTMAMLRARGRVSEYSVAADAAYELYLACRGENAVIRGNMWFALGQLDRVAAGAQERVGHIAARLGPRVLMPDTRRLPYVVPFFPTGDPGGTQAVFGSHGFDATLYHVDVARNLLAPRFERALLLPVHRGIPDEVFAALVNALAPPALQVRGSLSQPDEIPVRS